MKMNHSEAGRLGAIASRKTAIKRKLERRERYSLAPVKCPTCSEPIPFETRMKQKFCSHRCSAIHINKTFFGRMGPPRTRAYCEVCDKPHEMGGSRCRVHEQDERVELGLLTNRTTLKMWMIRKRGYRCENCHGTEWLGKPIPLEVDHTDGNAGNNLPNNLRVLCPNCHAQMPTSKGKNRGNGRKARGLPKN